VKSLTWLLLPVALAAGMAATSRFAIDSQLRQVVGDRHRAAALSYLVVIHIASIPASQHCS
jgi:uncharacterized membrane protein YdcZ (DUF606 family)